MLSSAVGCGEAAVAVNAALLMPHGGSDREQWSADRSTVMGDSCSWQWESSGREAAVRRVNSSIAQLERPSLEKKPKNIGTNVRDCGRKSDLPHLQHGNGRDTFSQTTTLSKAGRISASLLAQPREGPSFSGNTGMQNVCSKRLAGLAKWVSLKPYIRTSLIPDRRHSISPHLYLLPSSPSHQRTFFTMAPHQTPYVTPHILHKSYAASADAETSKRTYPAIYPIVVAHDPEPVIGAQIDAWSQAGFDMDRIQIKRNAPVSMLYEDAIRNEGAIIASSGALINFSGKKTGRSPKDKRIVYEDTSKDDIWWGPVNIKMDERACFTPSLIFPSNFSSPDTFEINRERAIDYLNTRDNVYVFDGYAGVCPIQPLPTLPLLTGDPVGSQVQDQGSRHLRACLPCSVHGQSAYHLP